jgi:hypothetical protein
MNRAWVTSLTIAGVVGTGGAAMAGLTDSGTAPLDPAPAAPIAAAVIGDTTSTTAPSASVITYQVGPAGTITISYSATGATVTEATPAAGWTVTGASAVGNHVEILFTDAAQTDLDIPRSATTVGPRLCITPERVDFGDSAGATAPITLTACGSTEVVISGLRFDAVDPELSLDPTPATPLTLAAGTSRALVVRYAPADAVGAAGTEPADPEARFAAASASLSGWPYAGPLRITLPSQSRAQQI